MKRSDFWGLGSGGASGQELPVGCGQKLLAWRGFFQDFRLFPNLRSLRSNRLGGRSLALAVFCIAPVCCIAPWCIHQAGTANLAFGTMQDDDKLKSAMAYRPVQEGVEYDQPGKEAMASIKLENASVIGQVGFVVRDSQDQLLRRFVDTDNDRSIDTWAYYLRGTEVYRDVDSDADKVPDRFQWLGPEGTRLGIDSNKDRVVDRWERISAQEATQEVVLAMREGTEARLRSLFLSADELSELNLEKEIADRVVERVKKSLSELPEAMQAEKLSSSAKWLHFGASFPGSISNAKGEVVEVFDNVSAIIEVGEDNRQLLVGSMIRVGNAWRLIDLPVLSSGDSLPAVGGVFFQSGPAIETSLAGETTPSGGVNVELLNAYQAAEDQFREGMGTAKGEDLAKLHEARSSALIKIAMASAPEDRENWVRQYADVVSAAFQSGEYPSGEGDLDRGIELMEKNNFDSTLVAYAKFRKLNAWYSRATEQADDLEEVQEQWQTKLNSFIDDYPKSMLAAEALFQLANIQDYVGDIENAEKLYRRIVADFPKSPQAPRSQGAVVRLTCEGKAIALSGATVNNQKFSLDGLKGKTVLVHYWATWCGPCKAEFDEMKDLYAKYKKDGFEIVSISLDESREDLVTYLQKTNDLPWIHLYEEGGLEASPLSAQLGIIALPTMILVGADGKVAERGTNLAQVERALRKLARE